MATAPEIAGETRGGLPILPFPDRAALESRSKRIARYVAMLERGETLL